MVFLAGEGAGGESPRRRVFSLCEDQSSTGEGEEEVKGNPAKAYLSRYRALRFKCATIHLKEICVQTSGGGERMAESVIKAIDATEFLDEQRRETEKTLREIMTAIKSVPDDLQQTVLIEKYVNGRTLLDIQNDIHYERRNTQIIHGKALWNVWQFMKKEGLAST